MTYQPLLSIWIEMGAPPSSTSLVDVTPKRYPIWVWGASFGLFFAIGAGGAALMLEENTLLIIGVFGGMSGIILSMISFFIFSYVYISPHGDRVVIRQFTTRHIFVYQDLKTITYVLGDQHAIQLTTATKSITVTDFGSDAEVINPFHKLLNELGEIIGWQTGALTRKIIPSGQSATPIVMFDASEGDRITGPAVFAKKLNHNIYVNTAASLVVLCIIAVFPIGYILALPPIEKIGLDNSFSELVVSLLMLAFMPLMIIAMLPDNRTLWGYSGVLAAFSTIGLVIGHQRAGTEDINLVGSAALCFAAVVATAMILRAVGLGLLARTQALETQYLAAIDAVIASGAVKDRSAQWTP